MGWNSFWSTPTLMIMAPAPLVGALRRPALVDVAAEVDVEALVVEVVHRLVVQNRFQAVLPERQDTFLVDLVEPVRAHLLRRGVVVAT
jgi:hypothetical protein